jgi:hypothetical protein
MEQYSNKMSCAKTELCIFDTALPQIVIENASFEEIFPINTITGKNLVDIEFNIVGSSTDYLDLNDTLLFVELKATGSEGKDLEAAADVTPSNYFFHTLFKDVVLSFNNERVEGGNNIYSHKALIETIMNYNNDTKSINLASIGYNSDAEERKKWIVLSKRFSMCGSLQLDFFDQPKYLIPGVNVHLRLQRNKSEFCLKSTDKPHLQILDTKLFVRRVKVDPSVLIAHQVGLSTKNAIYPIRKTELVSYSLPKGTMSFYKDQIFGDLRLPKFVLITFQHTDQFNGVYTAEASTYHHLDVTSLTLSRNNDFRESYTQDFKNNKYVTTYVTSIIRNMGHLDKNLNNGITMKTFKDTYPFFTFVLAPDFDIHQAQLPKQGNLRLDIKFDTALVKASSLLIYGVFDSDIQINKNRTIFI